MEEELPQLTPYFGSGSLVESTLNMGLAAPLTYRSRAPTSRPATSSLSLQLANFAALPAWPMSSSRRIWISQLSSSISIAYVPANLV